LSSRGNGGFDVTCESEAPGVQEWFVSLRQAQPQATRRGLPRSDPKTRNESLTDEDQFTSLDREQIIARIACTQASSPLWREGRVCTSPEVMLQEAAEQALKELATPPGGDGESAATASMVSLTLRAGPSFPGLTFSSKRKPRGQRWMGLLCLREFFRGSPDLQELKRRCQTKRAHLDRAFTACGCQTELPCQLHRAVSEILIWRAFSHVWGST
jgi:hypothetical protein